MKRIGISTVFTGYNYGSALQAFATKKILSELGYEGSLLRLSGNIIKGRDVRLNKLLVIAVRTLLHFRDMKRMMNSYRSSIKKTIHGGSLCLFEDFIKKHLQPVQLSYKQLKLIASNKEYIAFVCGSDQIWNSTNYYVDPFYYLRFAPSKKRIAFAPSFGRDYIPQYNKNKIIRYISDIPYLSIRETSGAALIKNLLNKDAEVLLDPTLILNEGQWKQALDFERKTIKEPYILGYFLDYPSENAQNIVKRIADATGYPIIGLPYVFDVVNWYEKIGATGPIEFLDLIKNAALVCTDSFHGTAFSINFSVPFYTFERQYGNAQKQSSRITSLLQVTQLENRFNPTNVDDMFQLDFSRSAALLNIERTKARQYLEKAIKQIEENSL